MPSFKKKMSLKSAMNIANSLVRELIKKGVNQIQIAGSIRRKSEVVGDIDIVLESDNLQNLLHGFWMEEGGDSRATIIYKGQQINLYKANKDNWGAMLLYLTGPSGYGIGLRMKAKKMGFTLNQYGLWKGKKLIASKTEQDMYSAMGKHYKEPEVRGK